MTTIKIDHNIPMPPAALGGARYPFRTMEVGDSFFVPVRPGQTVRSVQTRVSSAASVSGERMGRKYATRTIRDNGSSGVRVWRTK